MANDYYTEEDSYLQQQMELENQEFLYEIEMRKQMDYQDYLNELAKGDEHGK